MNKKIIIIVTVLIFSMLVIYYYLNIDRGHKVIMGHHEYLYGNKQFLYSNENFKESFNGNKYSISLWIKTDNIPKNAAWDSTTEKPKTILYKGSPNMYFLFPNTIRIQVGYKDKENILEYYNFDFNNFESQKWNNFVIVVNNRNINIYKNKLLVKSKYLDYIPWISKKMMYIGEKNNNFYGYIGFVDYYNYNLDNKQINNLYNKRKSQLPKIVLNYKQNLEYSK
jgi:hypothetical protein